MKKCFLILFLFITTTIKGFSQQEVLFIGLYTNASNGKSYWCRDMEMVKKVVNTIAEAQQLSVDFKKEHAKESPIVKIASKGAVVIYEYQKKDKAFNCTYRVIGWKEGNTRDEARQVLKNDEDRIRKEYNGQPNELFVWGTKRGDDSKIEISFKLEGVLIVLSKVDNNGGNGTWLANVKNPHAEEAAYVAFLIDDVRNPSDTNKSFKLQPGDELNMNLGKGTVADVLVRLGKKDEVEEPGIIQQVKEYIHQKIKQKGGKLETDGAPFTIRG